MKCLRCSYCCIEYDVIVPLSSTTAAYKPSGKRCWNLSYKNGKAVCKIHNKKFYKGSPCSQHTQIGEPGADCRMGAYILKEDNSILAAIKNNEVAVVDQVYNMVEGETINAYA